MKQWYALYVFLYSIKIYYNQMIQIMHEFNIHLLFIYIFEKKGSWATVIKHVTNTRFCGIQYNKSLTWYTIFDIYLSVFLRVPTDKKQRLWRNEIKN